MTRELRSFFYNHFKIISLPLAEMALLCVVVLACVTFVACAHQSTSMQGSIDAGYTLLVPEMELESLPDLDRLTVVQFSALLREYGIDPAVTIDNQTPNQNYRAVLVGAVGTEGFVAKVPDASSAALGIDETWLIEGDDLQRYVVFQVVEIH